jgi:hypothetical protein
LDEVQRQLKISGKRDWLWRAVDQHVVVTAARQLFAATPQLVAASVPLSYQALLSAQAKSPGTR